MRLWCALIVCLLAPVAVAHSTLPTRLLFTQKEQRLQLEATLDPLALSAALREQNIVLRLSIDSLQENADAIEQLLDEHLIVEAQKQECPREAPLSFLVVEGGLVQVKTMYQCKTALTPLLVRCDLFDDPRDPHATEAIFALASGVLPFVFDHESQVFRTPTTESAKSAPPVTEELSGFWRWAVWIGFVLGFMGVFFGVRARR